MINTIIKSLVLFLFVFQFTLITNAQSTTKKVANTYYSNYLKAKQIKDARCGELNDYQTYLQNTYGYRSPFEMMANNLVQSSLSTNLNQGFFNSNMPVEILNTYKKYSEECNKAIMYTKQFFKFYCMKTNYQNPSCMSALESKTTCTTTNGRTNCKTY